MSTNTRQWPQRLSDLPSDTRFFKVTKPNGAACSGGDGFWHIPKGKRPGKWMPPIKEQYLWPCRVGYHVVRATNVAGWISGVDRVVWEVEVRGKVINYDDKLVVGQARLLRPVLTPHDLALVRLDIALYGLSKIIPAVTAPGPRRPSGLYLHDTRQLLRDRASLLAAGRLISRPTSYLTQLGRLAYSRTEYLNVLISIAMNGSYGHGAHPIDWYDRYMRDVLFGRRKPGTFKFPSPARASSARSKRVS